MPTVAPIDVSRLRLCLPTPDQLNTYRRQVALTPEVEGLLDRNAVVAVGISSGKDSQAVALAVSRHLDNIGHTGPRLLVHADLGRVEWKTSLQECEKLAAAMGWELLVVRRQAGDLLSRWEGRWRANVRRYSELECVKVILPWSTPALRFCSGELKAQVITRELRKRYPTQEILNVTGIRREESSSRAKAPVSKALKELCRKGALGVTWNAVIEWKIEDVLQEIADAGLELHEAYTKYGSTRLSCCYCIMSSEADLMAAASCEDNHEVYVSLCELEAESTYAFQGNRWLSDVAPHLLSAELLAKIVIAKANAKKRVELEKALPEHLLYKKGWPHQLPTAEEAELIARLRRDVAQVMGLEVKYTTGLEVQARYEELMRLKAEKDAKKRKGAAHVDDEDEDEDDGDEADEQDAMACEGDQYALF